MPKRFRSSRKGNGIMHRIYWCTECEWRDEGYITAHKTSRKHVEETGHTIHGEDGHHVDVLPKPLKSSHR